jgi:hypothetical protein
LWLPSLEFGAPGRRGDVAVFDEMSQLDQFNRIVFAEKRKCPNDYKALSQIFINQLVS